MYFGMGISSAWYLQKMYMCEYKHVTENELLIKDRLANGAKKGMNCTAPSPRIG